MSKHVELENQTENINNWDRGGSKLREPLMTDTSKHTTTMEVDQQSQKKIIRLQRAKVNRHQV